MSDNLPVQLYQFLSEKIGSEDVVLTRRLLYSIVDYMCSTKHLIRMTSGSKGEGLDMKGSDLDIMVLLNNINIYEYPSAVSPPDSFIMSTKSTKPGFTHLQVCGKLNPILRSWCVNFENHLCLSGDLLKSFIGIWHNMSPPPSPVVIHGPCLSPDDYSEDWAITLRCKSWVGLAHQWITRNRSWPTSELVSKITEFGVLFVPIGCKGSPNESVEWRVSFSAAEKLLIHSFSHTQLLCYALLKSMLKDIIEQNEICKGLLCSYFLKTVVFWESESLPASEWRPDNIVSCFMKVFKRLLYFVEYNHLPHYFITDNDLFENRFSLEQHTALKTELSRLFQKGIYCMDESQLLSGFFYSVDFSLTDFMTRDEKNLLEKINIFLRFQPDDFMTTFLVRKSALEKLLDLQSHNKLKSNSFLYLTILYGVLQILGSKHIIRSTGNKVHYKNGYKQYFPYLICGRKTDAVSGWLYMASYFYKMKRYQSVLHIVSHVLPKFTQDKIFHRTGKYISCELSDIHENNSCQIHSNAGEFFRRKVIRYPRSSFLYSIVIPELEQLCFFSDLPPMVYAIFLEFLCFYHLSDVRRLRVALTDLQSAVQNIHSDLWLIATSNICLGVSYYMSGERDNARLCFTRAFESNHHDLPYFLNIYCRLDCLKK